MLFANYAKADGSKMEGEGIMQFLEDLGIDMEDPVTVAISLVMGAKS